jgi:hypothetical protein
MIITGCDFHTRCQQIAMGGWPRFNSWVVGWRILSRHARSECLRLAEEAKSERPCLDGAHDQSHLQSPLAQA